MVRIAWRRHVPEKRKGRTWQVTLEVVGLQFRWKKEAREVLSRAAPFPVEFEREPDNPHDPNAIKILIAGDFKLTKLRGKHLGYMRRGTAALFAAKLDAGLIEPVRLWVTVVDAQAGTATMGCRMRDIPAKRKRKTASKAKKKSLDRKTARR
jgi:hypothetical protein